MSTARARSALDDAIDCLIALNEIAPEEVQDKQRGKLENWSYLEGYAPGPKLVGDVIEHDDPRKIGQDMTTTTVSFIDRREDGLAITRNTVYLLVGREVTV